MIMDQHDETSFREGPCESFETEFLHAGIAVRHRNRRGGTFGAGNEQPTAQRHAALDPELDILSFRHRHLLFLLMLISPGPGQCASDIVRSTRPNGRPSTRYRSASAAPSSGNVLVRVSRSGYYQWKKAEPGPRERAAAGLGGEMRRGFPPHTGPSPLPPATHNHSTQHS